MSIIYFETKTMLRLSFYDVLLQGLFYHNVCTLKNDIIATNLLTAKLELVPNRELPVPGLEVMKAFQESFVG